MRVPDYCHASAVEAVNKANDPTLPDEARIEWARIAQVWKDVGRHYNLIEDAARTDPAPEARPRVNGTLH